MDRERLLQPEIQSFIREHEGDDLRRLMLQKDKYAHLPLRDIIEQIGARKKGIKKLPLWYKTGGILFPLAISVEQSSSEVTARYKAGLFSGKLALDLTGGFGVDSFYLAGNFEQINYVEENKELAEIARHNFNCLGQQNIKIISQSAEDFVVTNKQKYDLIYIDPDRRPGGDKRVTGFAESTPKIVELLPLLHKMSPDILIKASPMMDITSGIKELVNVNLVIILAVDNEVKELLFCLSQTKKTLEFRCVNIIRGGEQILECQASEERQEYCRHGKMLKFLYEPNAAIMKAGVHNLLCQKFDLIKLHRNTHLFTAEILIDDFPGRKFKVIEETPYKKSKILPFLRSKKANISVRNFPDTPVQVKKKLSLNDGGDQYLFCYRDVNDNLRIAVCEKV
jgi:PG_1098 ferredoxin-like domain/THUMP domain-like